MISEGVEIKTNISRRDFLGSTGAAAAVMPLAAVGKASTRPNVVYLFADEHRVQSMSFTGMPALRTPNMARMAAEGTFFENAISNNPLCVPHRAMLLTGRWCYSTGMLENNGTLAPWDKTLGHVFKAAGYATGYTGKWHLGSYPQTAGFDWHMHWNNTNEHWDSNWTDLHGTGKTSLCNTYNATKMTDQALEFIESNAKNASPFFLMVSWNPPHAEFTDPPEDKKALYPSPDQLPWRANTDKSKRKAWWKNYQGYHAHITAIDEEIGRVFQTLETLGVAENTIVVYSADHGSMMNSHGKFNKRRPEEESCRVPFLVRGPGIPSGVVRKELFGSIDIFPTLCSLAGIQIPAFCHGQDFSLNLRGGQGPDPASQLIMHIARKGVVDDLANYHTPFFRGVRGKRFTYSVKMDGPWQLFDNKSDPFQMKNLIDDPAYAGDRKRLQAELDGWIRRAEDPFLHPEYCAMPLGERIRRQALLHGKGVRLKEFLSRLKLSPAQDDQLKAIELSVYTEKGRPLAQGGRKAWDAADRSYRQKIKQILTPGQRARFEELEKLEKQTLG